MVDEDACGAVAHLAIPPCMVQEDSADQEACLLRTAESVTTEVGVDMKDCKCQSFNKIKDELLSVMELVCTERDPKLISIIRLWLQLYEWLIKLEV